MNTPRIASPSLSQASVTYACRLVDKTHLSDTLTQPDTLSSGQIALAVVEQYPQDNVVLADGYAHKLRPNSTLLVALGSVRSALGRSGVSPEKLGQCALLTRHGIVGIETARGLKRGEATQLRLLGLPLKHNGSVATLADFASPACGLYDMPRTYLLLGCANCVGETQALLNWTEGLSAQAIPNDFTVILLGDWQAWDLPARLFDAGAAHILDSTNIGLPHTHELEGDALLAVIDNLRTLAGLRGARNCLIALGGGYTRPEVQRLLATRQLATRIDGTMLAAADALSARTVALELQAHGLRLLGLSGTLANSPLAMREAQPLDTPILAPEKLADPAGLNALLATHFNLNGVHHVHLRNPSN